MAPPALSPPPMGSRACAPHRRARRGCSRRSRGDPHARAAPGRPGGKRTGEILLPGGDGCVDVHVALPPPGIIGGVRVWAESWSGYTRERCRYDTTWRQVLRRYGSGSAWFASLCSMARQDMNRCQTPPRSLADSAALPIALGLRVGIRRADVEQVARGQVAADGRVCFEEGRDDVVAEIAEAGRNDIKDRRLAEIDTSVGKVAAAPFGRLFDEAAYTASRIQLDHALRARCGCMFERERQDRVGGMVRHQQLSQIDIAKHVAVDQRKGLVEPAGEALDDRAQRAGRAEQLGLVGVAQCYAPGAAG